MRLPAMFRAAVLITAGILLGSLFADQPLVFAQKDDDEETSSLPLDELRAFTETFALIKRNYVEPVDDKKLLDAALRGMLAGLDPHSSYLDGEDYKELKTGTSGEFGGLGIEVGMEDGFVKVIAPIDDTPAQRAGIEPGDLIVRLDEQPVKGMSLSDAVKIMRGKPGTDIELTVVREGEAKPLKIVITRAVIQITSVRSRMLEPGYGYLRVSHFQVNTGKKMREELASMTEDQPLQGLVLDLRNN
ncbi:MAG: PDZ domain-containing protein, partial [Pseudomonadota bacterium]|nr:PDZ domain-containing protein [Pseudomonadota bacterium]